MINLCAKFEVFTFNSYEDIKLSMVTQNVDNGVIWSS